MLNQSHLKLRIILLIGYLTLSVGVVNAADSQQMALLPVQTAAKFDLLPSGEALKKAAEAMHIYEYDDIPLGNRKPLLFVHGMRGEFWPTFRWGKVCEHLGDDAAFRSRYKIFLVRYNSYAPVKKLAHELGEQILHLSDACQGKSLNVVALSMGGNVVAESLKEESVDDVVDRVITLGTPFHGTPLFTSVWMHYSMMRHYKMPLSRLDVCLPYTIYFSKHSNLVDDLRWDNADKFLPDVGRYEYYFPLHYSGELSPAATTNNWLLREVENKKIDKKKFVVYGGYLKNTYTEKRQQSRLNAALTYPGWLAKTTIPMHMGQEHPVLRVLNEHIARAVPATEVETELHGKYAYGLNDGICPIGSSLFLPVDALQKRSFSTPEDVSGIRSLVDVGKARVFEDVDHLSFIDEYRPPGGELLVNDKLSPNEGKKSLFDWLRADLLDKEGTLAEQDREVMLHK